MAKPIRRKKFEKPVIPMDNPLKGVAASDINYKNVELLQKFIQDKGRIRSREITGVSVQEQRKVALAIKNARELALLPFVQNIVAPRNNRDRDDRGGRYNRDRDNNREGGRDNRESKDSKDNKGGRR